MLHPHSINKNACKGGIQELVLGTSNHARKQELVIRVRITLAMARETCCCYLWQKILAETKRLVVYNHL